MERCSLIAHRWFSSAALYWRGFVALASALKYSRDVVLDWGQETYFVRISLSIVFFFKKVWFCTVVLENSSLVKLLGSHLSIQFLCIQTWIAPICSTFCTSWLMVSATQLPWYSWSEPCQAYRNIFWSKINYFDFNWPQNVLSIFIRLLFMFSCVLLGCLPQRLISCSVLHTVGSVTETIIFTYNAFAFFHASLCKEFIVYGVVFRVWPLPFLLVL